GRARAGRRTRAPLRRPLARVAPREGRAHTRGRQGGAALRRRYRAARALHRALPVQEVEGEAGAGEADADRAPRAGTGAELRRARLPDAPTQVARLRLPRPAAKRADRR